MKKSILFAAVLALSLTACTEKYGAEDTFVATFEEAAITPAAPDTVFHLKETGSFTSGNFTFTQEVADYGEWGVYYFGNIVSNETSNKFEDASDDTKSAVGGAKSGKNYLVWTASYTGEDKIALKEAAVVPGMYVWNTAWVADAIKNGDGMSEVEGGFGDDDWFLLTVKGTLNAMPVANTVEFYLAKGQNAVNEWTYVDLSPLGKVDHIAFELSSTKKNAIGMTTPAYFCIDNFGAKK